MALDQTELQELEHLLSQLEPGYLPNPIFLQFARIGVLPTCELIPIRSHDGAIEVLLTRRDDDDPNWPSQWHTPGTVIRSTDAADGMVGALSRLAAAELPGVVFKGKPVYVATILQQVKRGAECDTVFYTEVEGDIAVGQWFDVTKIPEDVVETQRGLIQAAALNYTNKLHTGVN